MGKVTLLGGSLCNGVESRLDLHVDYPLFTLHLVFCYRVEGTYLVCSFLHVYSLLFQGSIVLVWKIIIMQF